MLEKMEFPEASKALFRRLTDDLLPEVMAQITKYEHEIPEALRIESVWVRVSVDGFLKVLQMNYHPAHDWSEVAWWVDFEGPTTVTIKGFETLYRDGSIDAYDLPEPKQFQLRASDIDVQVQIILKGDIVKGKSCT